MVRVLQHCPARLKENNKLNDDIDRDVQGVKGNIEDEMAKEGACLFELRRAGLTQWGFSGAEMYFGESKENALKLENGLHGDKGASVVRHPIQKKRRLSISNLEEAEVVSCEEKGLDNHKVRSKCNKVERWSEERYATAQQSMLEILKAEGAVFGKAISRHDLRAAARERIGDTGLLDHLLKHIDGKVALGGTERFRRCYNTDGVMQYWLESADLDEIRRNAGVSDPYWIPPSELEAGEGLQLQTAPPEELKLLKVEMDNFKGDLLGIITKDLERVKDVMKEETHKELVKWNGSIKQRLLEIRSSASNVQDMSKDLMSWKDKVEQQIMELSNAVKTLQSADKGTTICPDRWDDLLGGANLDNNQVGDFAPWWESSGLLSVGEETAMSTKLTLPEAELKAENTPPMDPAFSAELNVLKDEVANIKRKMKELGSKKQDEDQSNGTLDSVISTNSKLDLDNGLVIFKEMYTDMAKWRPIVEKKVDDLANAVAGIMPK